MGMSMGRGCRMGLGMGLKSLRGNVELSRRLGTEAQDRVLGYSQPSPSTSSGQALRD